MNGISLSSLAPSPHPGSSPLPPDPLAVSVVTQCDTLTALVREWEERVREGGREEGEVRNWISPDSRQYLASWLIGTPVVRECVLKEVWDIQHLMREKGERELFSPYPIVSLHSTHICHWTRNQHLLLSPRERWRTCRDRWLPWQQSHSRE